LHSNVRSLCFGEEAGYFHYLNCNTAAYSIERHATLQNSFYTLTAPGRQAAVYPIRGGRLATFFTYTASEPPGRLSPEAAAAELRTAFSDMGWIVPTLLEQLDPAGLYFDAVAQIEMPHWTSGRVVLLGDAAWCVSLLAGQGASMAMAGAETLAEELQAGDVGSALARYEARLRPVIQRKQAAGRRMRNWFLPESRLRLALRDAATRIAMSPVGAPLLSRVIAP
jgi:2-polyprenyl-6-methoxyphenol hydroxylase-like FAD-dependent oxidoreductase